jgi:hypothetical protein
VPTDKKLAELVQQSYPNMRVYFKTIFIANVIALKGILVKNVKCTQNIT